MFLGVDKRGFTQRVEREGVKLENREGQTQKGRQQIRGQGETQTEGDKKREVRTELRQSFQ